VLFTGFSVLAWSLQNCARFIAVSAAPRAARLVFRDERTGLYTARYMLERLQHEVSRSARYSSTFSVLYVRLRGLETWAAGACQPERDAFWHDLAFSIRTVTRRADLAAHWSADSLLMFLPNTEFLSGYMLAERLEEILGEADTLRARRGPMAWRPEIGCATYPYDGKDARELIRYAELAAHRGINTHAGCNPLTGRITSCDL
jgi:diguanylate cyclase (GGDEF)-like protein